MMLKRLHPHGEKGIGAVEFALLAPVFISFIVGVSQLGRLFYANADMKNAAAHAARLASIYRTEGTVDDATLIAAVKDRLMREGATSRVTVTVARGTDDGNPYVELNTSYSVPLEFIFFSTPPVTLHDTRRVYTQVATANGTAYSSGGTSTSTTSTSTTSSGTTTGGTTSTSTGSTGGSTSATSASSTGGSTSTTSASSTGGSTSASSTSTSSTSTTSTSTSSTSSGNNGSSGNASSSGNNGSSGHAHGDCKKC